MKRQDIIDRVPEWWKYMVETWLMDLDDFEIEDLYISCIKEKYWRLRFEYSWECVELEELETVSWYICDTCWQSGRVRYDLWWYRCLCEKHYKNIKKEVKTHIF